MHYRIARPIKYIGFGFAVIALLALAIAPFSKRLVEQWSRSDVEARSRLVYKAIQNPVARAMVDSEVSRLSAIFENVALDDRILAVGLCDESGRLINPTKLMPATFSCDKVARSEAESFSTIVNDGRPILVGAFPIVERNQKSYLIILHDLSFIDTRSGEAQGFVIAILAGVAIAIAGVAAAFIVVMLRGWMKSLRRAVEEIQSGAISPPRTRDRSAIDDQIKKLLGKIEVGRQTITSGQIDWSPAALQELLHKVLPGAEVIVISNREPYIHNHTDGEHLPADPGQRPGIGAGAGDAGMRRHLDRARQRRRRPGDSRQRRQDRGAAGRAFLHACGASGSPRRNRTDTTTVSPTRASGRCATSHSCGRSSAKATGSTTRRSTNASPRPSCRKRRPKIRSCWCRTTTSRSRRG